jgi:glycosyltransferase involved in cell wall biosynthesis
MYRFWESVLHPIFERVNPRYIVEVGSEKGRNTNNILKYCEEKDARITAIDPLPQFDVDEFKELYGEKFEIYTDLSLNILPLLDDYDIILLDGDHNWYTVYNELKIIGKTFENKKFPMVIMHDIGWPYDRRDLYYNPNNIPPEFRQPYKQLGIYPEQAHLAENGGFNPDFNHSIYENNPHNGVLTAIEDFISESPQEFSFVTIPGFHGVGILFSKDDKLEEFVKNVIYNSDIMKMLEDERIKLYIDLLELKISKGKMKNRLESRIKEDLIKIRNLEGILKTDNINLEALRSELKVKNHELEMMYIILSKLQAQLTSYKRLSFKEWYYQKKLKDRELEFEKIKSEMDNLNKIISETGHSNYEKSAGKWLISTFPSIYFLSKMKQSGFKNVLANIKGYKAIKKNNLLDVNYYLKNNPDVRISGTDPIIHYIFHGFKEDRLPNPKFDGKYYLEEYDDVKESKINPLVHYSIYGLQEHRKTIKKPTANSTEKLEKHEDLSNSDLETENKFKNEYISDLFSNAFDSSSEYVDNDEQFNVELREDDVKLIAFYLPQFHPFSENDEWWGKGFTEWDNVTKAVPMFLGHYQPHLPVDLGFYDLRLIESQKRQIELSQQYGIFGFCYYYYWFNGKKLMETPLDIFINNPKELNNPFCLCWANENWTRCWDGNENEILISQEYTPEDDLNFIKDMSKYLIDTRYIKVEDKLLIMVYKPQLLPNPKKTFELWRNYCREEGIGELYIIGAKRHDFILEPEEYGLDGAYEFPPNNPHPTQLKEDVQYLNPDYKPTVYDLEKFVQSKNYMMEEEGYKKFKTVTTSWDNTPRRLNDGQVYIGNPDVYKEWLIDIMEYTKSNFGIDKQFVFINAWNEWAEGAHLEPDKKYGYAYLRATAESIIDTRYDNPLNKSLEIYKVSVIIPTYNRASVVEKAIDSALGQTYENFKIIVVDDGSTDKTEELIKSKYAKYLDTEKLLYIKQENNGVSCARNTGLKQADGDLVAYLDSDNLWKPRYLEKMVELFNDPEVNLAYCAMEVYDSNKEPFYDKHYFIRNDSYNRDKLIKRNFIDLNVFMHRKIFYEKMGGFNESLKSMVDWDLILRYTRTEEPFFLNEILVEYYLDENLKNLTYTVDHDEDYQILISLHSPNRMANKPSKASQMITCPICGNTAESFLNYGQYLRKNALCPKCGSLERHRAIYLLLKDESKLEENNIKLLHIAPEYTLYNLFIDKENIEYLPVDLDVNNKFSKEKMDIQRIEYPDNSFDLIICSHVLEHVPRDMDAMDELYRVLKPEGNVIIMVPLSGKNETFEDTSILTPEDRIIHYEQEDHLRFYGYDFEDKLKEAGFKIVSNDFIQKMDETEFKKYSLFKNDIIFYCTK